jgi:dihydroxyacetone kinase-like predicted kinase
MLDGRTFRDMYSFAIDWFAKSEGDVNALNVFPIPDGDTGTNMLLTMRSSIEEAARSDDSSAASMLKSIAHGALMGARGNSGVILALIWRGMSDGLKETDRLCSRDLAKAFQAACAGAYGGLEKPVEGTILTVMKEIAAATEKYLDGDKADITCVFETAVEAARKAVANTPNLLPVLKEAGVVDSGGQGLCILFEGTLMYLKGETDQLLLGKSKIISIADTPGDHAGGVDERYEYLLRGQEQEHLAVAKTGVVTVATGEGFTGLFNQLGASAVVPGGRTMNSSAKQILQAVESVESNQVIILPNDKNLVLVAQKIGTLTTKTVKVVATTTIPQGIAAILAFNSEADLQTNIDLMTESKSQVKTVEVTSATRSTKLNGISIRKGQAIGLVDGKLVAVNDDRRGLIPDILEKIDLTGAESITIYYGADSKKDEADNIRELMFLKNQRLNIEVNPGGQPFYNFIISIE